MTLAPFVDQAGTRRAKSQERCLLRAPEYYRYPLGESQTVKNKNEKKKHKKKGRKKKEKKRPAIPGVTSPSMDDSLTEFEQVLAVAFRTEAESAPRELRRVQTQLTRFAADLEAARRRLEAVRPALAAAEERVARLEAAEPALMDARTRLHALEAAGPGLEQVRTRVHTLSSSLESARRVLETTAPEMLPGTRYQVRALATELEAVSRTLSAPTLVLEALQVRVRALEALEPLLAAARHEVQALEYLVPALEAARRELRGLATELEAPRRALDAAVGAYQHASGPSGASPED
jgi:chromosome segregation ATPase